MKEKTMQLKFIYTNMPFWRAEVGRLSLFLGDVEFEDLRIEMEEFKRAKDCGKLDDGTVMPFHQMPVLVVDGTSIAQTGGIARFCGKLSGLYPIEDHLKAAKIDQFIDLATDLNTMVSSTNQIKDTTQKLAARIEMAKGPLNRKLWILERSVSEESDWIIPPSISIADIAIWRVLGWFTSGLLDGIPKDLLSEFPKIRKVCLAVDQHPKVQEWILKTYPKNYARGSY
jgi:glutathione S-transferase